MKTKTFLSSLALILFLLPIQILGQVKGCPSSQDLNDCINVRARELVKAKTDQNSSTKQTETPSASANSTSLVDQSSASDLVGVALNLAGLTGSSQSNGNQPNSFSVTTSAYALYSAFTGVDPLNPDFYNAHRDWRRFSVTLGYDDEKIGTTTDTQRVKLIGVKYLAINHRDPNRDEFRGDLDNILSNLKAATTDFSRIINQVKTFIFKNEKVVSGIITPDFRTYLGRRAIETDRAVLTAMNLAKVAEQTAIMQPTNPRAVVDAVNAAARAAVASPETPIAVNAAAVEMSDAIESAAKNPPRDVADDPSKVVLNMITVAKGAADDISTRAIKIKTHLETLKGQPITTLFVFENGFLVDKSDLELAGFRSEFINNYMAGPGFARVRALLGSDLDDEIDKALKDLSNFTALRQVSLDTIDKIRRAPQLSLAYFTKQRKEGADEHKAEVIFDWGIARKLNLTANGTFIYHDSQIIGGDRRGASFSVQFRYQVNRNDLYSLLGNRKPIYFDLSAEGSRMTGQDTIIKGQAKLTIPLGATGIDFPISLTLANRTELIKEKEVRGQFGFTFDIAKLMAALQPK